MDEYFFSHCGDGCHTRDGFAGPPKADDDIDIAYEGVLRISADVLLDTIENGDFCVECQLEPEGEVYQGIAEWLDCP